MSWLFSNIINNIGSITVGNRKCSETELKQLLLRLIERNEHFLLSSLEQLANTAEFYHQEIGTAHDALFSLLKDYPSEIKMTTLVLQICVRILTIKENKPQDGLSLFSFQTEQKPVEPKTEKENSVEANTAVQILSKQENVEILVKFFDSLDTGICYYSLCVFSSLARVQLEKTQTALFFVPNSISKISEMISDSRPMIRDESVTLLSLIAKNHLEIQKLLSFESCFERTFGIIFEENGNEGGKVVLDSLELIAVLLRGNQQNQTLFLENGHLSRLFPLLDLRNDKYLILEAKANVMIKTLKVCAVLARESQIARFGLFKGGILPILIDVIFTIKHGNLVNKGFRTLAFVLYKSPPACAFFTTATITSEISSEKRINVLFRVIQIALSQKINQKFYKNVFFVLQCYFHENFGCQIATASTFLPQPDNEPLAQSTNIGSLMLSNLSENPNLNAVTLFNYIIKENNACKKYASSIPVDLSPNAPHLLEFFVDILKAEIDKLDSTKLTDIDNPTDSSPHRVSVGPECVIAFLRLFAEWFSNALDVVKRANDLKIVTFFLEQSKKSFAFPNIQHLFCLLVCQCSQNIQFWSLSEFNKSCEDIPRITRALEQLKIDESLKAKRRKKTVFIPDNFSSIIGNALGMFILLSELTLEQRAEKIAQLFEFEKEETKQRHLRAKNEKFVAVGAIKTSESQLNIQPNVTENVSQDIPQQTQPQSQPQPQPQPQRTLTLQQPQTLSPQPILQPQVVQQQRSQILSRPQSPLQTTTIQQLQTILPQHVNSTVANATSEQEKETCELRAQITSFQTSLKGRENDFQNLQSKYTQLEQELQNIHQEFAQVSKENEEIKNAALKQAEEFNSVISQYYQANQSAYQENLSLQSELENLKQHCQNYDSQTQDKEIQTRFEVKLQRVQHEKALVESERNQILQQINEIQNENEKLLKEKNDQIVKLQKETAELTSSIEKQTNELNKLQKRYNQLEKENIDMQEIINLVEAEKAELEKEFSK